MAGACSPLEIKREVKQAEAETALKILNWFFDDHPELYLIQKPRIVYDSEGNQRPLTFRYYMKAKEQDPAPKADADPAEGRKSNQNDSTENESLQGETASGKEADRAGSEP